MRPRAERHRWITSVSPSPAVRTRPLRATSCVPYAVNLLALWPEILRVVRIGFSVMFLMALMVELIALATAAVAYLQAERLEQQNTLLKSQSATQDAAFHRGITQGRSGEAQAAMATYDEVVERFGDSDMPELQVQVAKALVNKAITQGQIGEAQAAITTCDKAVACFKDSDAPEITIQVARALGVKTEALLVREDPLAAMETFRSMYAAFVPGHEIVMRQLLALVPDLIAAGASERELVEALSSDSEKADTIVPLVVALRQRTGEVVRAPGEVLEVAADIRERIEAKVGSGDTVSPGRPSA